MQAALGRPGWYGLSPQTRDETAAALKEALLNAFFHGHKCVSTMPVTVALRSDHLALTLTVADQGAGFDHQHALRNPRPAGLSLILAVMDEVRWNQTGNEITMTKRKRPPAPNDARAPTIATDSEPTVVESLR